MWLDPPSSSKTGVAIGGIVKETKLGKTLIEDDEGKVGIGVPLQIPPYGAQALAHQFHRGNPFIPGQDRAKRSPALMKGFVCLDVLRITVEDC